MPHHEAFSRKGTPDDKTVRRFDIRLHFVEPAGIGPGERVFSVALEGKTVLSNLDIAREAKSPHAPVVREFLNQEVTVALNLTFTPVRGQPVLCGIELRAR